MNFVKIPNINDAWDKVKIETLSPSVFSWISSGCSYQALLQKALKVFNNDSYFLPTPKNAILGTIIHSIYELTAKGELSTMHEMVDKWEELIEKQSNILIRKYPTISRPDLNNYDKRNKAIRYALALASRGSASTTPDNNIITLPEERIECQDIGLIGVIDKLVIDNDQIDIIDYKSGAVTDENGNIKEDYVVQLHLYAAMCTHKKLGEIHSLKLIDINGEVYGVPYDEQRAQQLLVDVQNSISRLNKALEDRDFDGLINPDAERCCYCSCRHICKRRIQSSDSPYKTISGKVESIPSSNVYMLNDGQSKYCISGLDVYQVANQDRYIGKELVFVNVARSSNLADDFTFKITANTLVYELE